MEDIYIVIKWLLVVIAMLIAGSASGCGFSNARGDVWGTTGYLREYNAGRGRGEVITDLDREQLSKKLARY